MSDQKEIDLLLQKDWREDVIPNFGSRSNDPWIQVYLDKNREGNVALNLYSGLVPNEHASKLLDKPYWEFHESDPVTSFTGTYQSDTGENSAQYHRYGPNDFDIEPLILVRRFNGLRSQQAEIVEEFRLFHKLWYDEKKSAYVKFDDGGYEIEVARVANNRIDISRLHLRQFLAARNMSLVLYFMRKFHPGRTYKISEGARAQSAQTDNYVYCFRVVDGRKLVDGTPETSSWLLGKKIIAGLERKYCGIWPYEEHSEEIELEDFVVAVDENEKKVFASSGRFYEGPRSVNKNTTTNLVAAQYLTPVFFKRKVLDKYWREPSKYKVLDGYLKCVQKWLLQADTNHPEYVIVLLGDLGRDLPHTEHKHWKENNVSPDGNMSDSQLRALFPSTVEEALDPGPPEDIALRFKRAYRNLSIAWKKRLWLGSIQSTF